MATLDEVRRVYRRWGYWHHLRLARMSLGTIEQAKQVIREHAAR